MARAQYKSRYQLDGAHKDIEAALNLEADADRNAILLYAARTYFQEGARLGENDQARQILLAASADCYADLRTENPSLKEAYWGGVDAFIQLQDLDAAARLCDEGLSEFDTSRELLSRRAQIHVLNDEFEEVGALLRDIDLEKTAEWEAPLDAHTTLDANVEIVRSLLAIKERRFQDAVRLISPIANNAEVSTTRLDAKKLLGNAYQSLGMWDAAASDI